ncbi:MAG: DUF3570 domain-containing protein [Bacteroidota bacterium]
MVNLAILRKRLLLLGTLLFSWWASPAQPSEASLYRKDTLKKTEIELLYSHYLQDGNNSAVTGGTGTEKLTVYATQLKLKRTFNPRNSLSFQGGADVITSASTDRIDRVISSASEHDIRSYANVDYTHQLKEQPLQLSIGTGISLESDYLSLPYQLGLFYDDQKRLRTYALDVQFFYDDLRWGRIDKDYFRPVRLIYPSELRDREWFDGYSRTSLNVKTGFTQAVNRRLVLGIFPEWTYQRGVLATPFHRAYFTDGSVRVENLPDRRIKTALGLKANAFVGGRTILKNDLNLYRDNYGILAIALEQETVVKLNYLWRIAPFVRIYHQKGTRYFAPFQEHELDAEYYTSDYDLSTFTSFKGGIALRYTPGHYLSKRLTFNELRIRYSFFHRSDNLQAHVISVQFAGVFYAKSKQP